VNPWPSASAQRISQRELESYLWGAATLLRGLIDAGDYKGYIFPLVFLKRISDVWDEEHAVALDVYGDAELADLPENHRFVIPNKAHWDDIRQTTRDVGRKIVTSMRAVETVNPDALTGVFGDADWTNKDLLSDKILADLVEHFSVRILSAANLPEDELGNGYEYLIKKFADDSGHTAQEFYTNRTLVHLMTKMLDPQPGESAYDPTCGTGGMLISCVAELKRRGQEHRTLRLYGQERNYTTASIAKMNLFLHGIEDGHIAHGDTLAAPAFLDAKDRLCSFDVALANPPYSIKAWNRDAFVNDPYGRDMWGVPPQGRADYAFFQHIAASLNPRSGRAAILFPHGVLFRQEEKALRERLVRSGLLESVIGLGAGLFYNSPMEAVVVTLRAGRPIDQANSVLFINAVNLFSRERGQSFLRNSDQEIILDAYQRRTDIVGLAALATIQQIAHKDFSLAIPLYVKLADADTVSAHDGQKLPDEAQVAAHWLSAAAAADNDVDELLALLRSGRARDPKS
jgi:type I restriction system adenine methylase HsdM